MFLAVEATDPAAKLYIESWGSHIHLLLGVLESIAPLWLLPPDDTTSSETQMASNNLAALLRTTADKITAELLTARGLLPLPAGLHFNSITGNHSWIQGEHAEGLQHAGS